MEVGRGRGGGDGGSCGGDCQVYFTWMRVTSEEVNVVGRRLILLLKEGGYLFIFFFLHRDFN